MPSNIAGSSGEMVYTSDSWVFMIILKNKTVEHISFNTFPSETQMNLDFKFQSQTYLQAISLRTAFLQQTCVLDYVKKNIAKKQKIEITHDVWLT